MRHCKAIIWAGILVVGAVTTASADPSSAQPVALSLSRVALSSPVLFAEEGGAEEAEATNAGVLSFNGSVSDGNSRKKTLAAVADWEWKKNKERFTVGIDWNYSEDQGDVSTRNSSGRLKYDHFLSDRAYYYAATSARNDAFADLDLRLTVGVGAGYQFLDKKLDDGPVAFYEELGVSYVDENFSGPGDDDYAAGRLSGKIDWNVRDGVDVFHFHEVLFGFEDQDDVIVDTKTGIRFQISDRLFANFQVNWTWDNTPAAGNRRTDALFLGGVGYKFSF